MGGRKDDGKAVRAADSRIGWQKKNGGASGGTPSVRKNGRPVGGGAFAAHPSGDLRRHFRAAGGGEAAAAGKDGGRQPKAVGSHDPERRCAGGIFRCGRAVYQGWDPGGGGGRGVPGRVPSGGRGDPADRRPDSGRRGTDGAAELAGCRAVEHDPACGRGPGSGGAGDDGPCALFRRGFAGKRQYAAGNFGLRSRDAGKGRAVLQFRLPGSPLGGDGAVSLRRGSGSGYRYGHRLLCRRHRYGGRGEQQLRKILHRHPR